LLAAELDPEPNPFSREERDRFMRRVATHEDEWLEYFQFLFDVGVRVGEAAALKWANVDLDQKVAKIEASYSPSDNRDKARRPINAGTSN
jgi:integrase